MSANSNIEWTDHTFNPWIGCTKVSPGCDHCYAERSTPARVQGVMWGPEAPRQRTSQGNWALPRRWNARHEAFYKLHGRRQRVFCASLADVFDNAVPVQWRIELMKLITETRNLDWLLLTKRIGNAAPMLETAFRAVHQGREGWAENSLPNVWIGATIVNQAEADRDIPKLLAVPAAKRFLSMEPLLGPVRLGSCTEDDHFRCSECDHSFNCTDETERPRLECPSCGHEPVHVDQGRIDWVIVGGESGPGARPMHPDWARSLRDQCEAAGVPFLFKQWGENLPLDQQGANGDLWTPVATRQSPASTKPFVRCGKKAAGRLLDGIEHNGFPS